MVCAAWMSASASVLLRPVVPSCVCRSTLRQTRLSYTFGAAENTSSWLKIYNSQNVCLAMGIRHYGYNTWQNPYSWAQQTPRIQCYYITQGAPKG